MILYYSLIIKNIHWLAFVRFKLKRQLIWKLTNLNPERTNHVISLDVIAKKICWPEKYLVAYEIKLFVKVVDIEQ